MRELIRVVRKGSKVEILLPVDAEHDHDTPRGCECGRVIEVRFIFDAGSKVYAGLLTRRIRDGLRCAIQNARTEAYEQGYADGRGHRPKENWQSGCLNGEF